ncbi:hypothetical protein [Rhodococcus opacus]|uniref:hypothetical protein n=1 Tax=Rhodococcus opacus TaxID=37919 RepID=UPI0006BB47E2|nr:hypothetical protein [Rhodococcus opacus]
MLSAARSPVVLAGHVRLHGIRPADPGMYVPLRRLHTALGYLLFAACTTQLCPVTFHTLALRDRLLARTTLLPDRRGRSGSEPSDAPEAVGDPAR